MVVAVSLLADLLTKLAAANSLDPGVSHSWMGGVLRLTLVRNRGAAFGLLPGNQFFFVVASLVALGVVAYLFWRLPRGSRRESLALGLVAGGALGNLVDRLRLGEVIDFLDIGVSDEHRWPTFNLADAAVTIGVLLLVLWLGKSRTEKVEEESG